MKRRVVVTGMGVVTTLGCKVEELWTRICNGESGVKQLEQFDCEGYRARIAGEITHWAPDEYISKRAAKKLDRFAQFAYVAAVEAIQQASLDVGAEDPYRCGVVLGTGIGGLCEIETQHSRLILKGPDKVSAFTIPKLMANAATAQVSIKYGLKGPTTAVSTACASASSAIGDALKAIQYDEADVMVTGGTEAAVTPMGISAFGSMRALSERNDEPTRASRPFDLDRDGFVLSEGAGIIVLEELEHARSRGAPILAEMLACGVSSDGSHLTQPDKNGIGGARAMKQALQVAAVDPNEVGYINAHGTSTPLGDSAETVAIKSVFGEHAYRLSISSTKSQLGHMLGASGGVEMVLTVLAIKHGLIPPTINYETPDPACDLDYTPNEVRSRDISLAISNSFGFGGHNVSLLVGKLRNDTP